MMPSSVLACSCSRDCPYGLSMGIVHRDCSCKPRLTWTTMPEEDGRWAGVQGGTPRVEGLAGRELESVEVRESEHHNHRLGGVRDGRRRELDDQPVGRSQRGHPTRVEPDVGLVLACEWPWIRRCIETVIGGGGGGGLLWKDSDGRSKNDQASQEEQNAGGEGPLRRSSSNA